MKIKQIPLWIDTSIDRMFGIEKNHLSHSESVRYIFSCLLNLVSRSADQDNKQNQKLLCISFSSPEDTRRVVDEIVALMHKEDAPDAFDIMVGGNLMTSSDTMMRLSQCDTVILFEKKDQSQYSTIRKGLAILEEMNKKVLGLVLME